MHDSLRMGWRWRTGWTWAGAEEPATIRRTLRVLVGLLALVAFVYCARAGWDVLQTLRLVRLSDLRMATDLLSVGDVVLCLVGYGLGKEILKAAVRRR